MSYKHVVFRSAAREKVLRGAGQLADAARVTLGPKSKSVLIQRKWGAPLVCNDVVTIAKGNHGFDAAQKRYVDLVEAGIIDPTKVVCIALENAVSVASTLLLSEATMTEVEEEKRETPAERELSPL